MQAQSAAAAQTTLQLQRLVSPIPPPLLEFDCDVVLTNWNSEALLFSLESATASLPQQIPPSPTRLSDSTRTRSPQTTRQTAIFRQSSSNGLRFDFELPSLEHNPFVQQKASDLLALLSHPALALRLYAASNSTPSYSLPDLYATFPDASAAQAAYFPKQKILQCRWKFAASATMLHTTPTLFSIPDLAGSSFRLDMTNSPATFGSFIHPRRIKLLFGAVATTVTNFADLPLAYSRHVRMPPQELAALLPDVPQADLAERDDPNFNPDGIVACRGAFPGLDQIRGASGPIRVPRVAPPPAPLPPINLRIVP